MAVNDIYRVEVLQNVGSEITMNVLHLRETVSETVSTRPAENVVEIVSAMYDELKDQLSEDWRVVQITARRIKPTGGIPATVVFGGVEPIVGAIESEIIPSTSALLISLYSNNAERTGRGRQYIPGLPETAQNEGQLTEAAHGAFTIIANNAYEGEKGPIGASDGKYRVHVYSPDLAVSGSNDVQETIVRPNLATQRRRRAFPGFAG